MELLICVKFVSPTSRLRPQSVERSPASLLVKRWQEICVKWHFFVHRNWGKPLIVTHMSQNINPFMPTVPTFAVRETDVSQHNGGTSGAPLKPLRDDSALRALSSLRALRGAPEVPPLCRETSVSRTANVGTVGKNWLILVYSSVALP